eukprot:m.700649 g.700649  ORF g.700649 m.700649 type:complete len:615 (+) comp22910_c0_seq1:84-1928(+)
MSCSTEKTEFGFGDRAASEVTTKMEPKPKKPLHPIKQLIQRMPEFLLLFDLKHVDDKGATLLPKVAVNVEIENILDIDLEHGYVHLEYALFFDWVDIISVKEYQKSKNDANYWRDTYPFQPQAQLQNAINTGGDAVEMLASKQGTRFGKRFALGTFSGCEDHVLVTLKRTIKSEANIKLPKLSLQDYPLDHHHFMLGFEFVTFERGPLLETLRERTQGAFSASSSKRLKLTTSTATLRLKSLKKHEEQYCSLTGMRWMSTTFPLILPTTAEFQSFIMDASAENVDDLDTMDPNRQIIAGTAGRGQTLSETYWENTSGSRVALFVAFYRTSRNFWMSALLPVVLVVLMSLTVNAVDPVDGVADRLAIILTLWLTLYAHKYVIANEMQTDENTPMDYIIIIGYFGLIAMALLVSLYGNELISETLNFVCQGVVVLVLLCATMLYGVYASRHQGAVQRIHDQNFRYVHRWLYSLLGNATKEHINDRKRLVESDKRTRDEHNFRQALMMQELVHVHGTRVCRLVRLHGVDWYGDMVLVNMHWCSCMVLVYVNSACSVGSREECACSDVLTSLCDSFCVIECDFEGVSLPTGWCFNRCSHACVCASVDLCLQSDVCDVI